MKKLNKRCQHETLGFILIIVLVMIGGLILLGLMLTKPAKIGESSKISHFLISAMHHTTDCQGTRSAVDYRDVEDLIISCYKNQICVDNRLSCLALNKTMKQLLLTLKADPQADIRGYELMIYANDSSQEIKEVLYLSENFKNCTSKYGADEKIYSSAGLSHVDIHAELTICAGN